MQQVLSFEMLKLEDVWYFFLENDLKANQFSKHLQINFLWIN